MKMLEDGDYDAVILAPASVYENKNGVLTLVFSVGFKPTGEVELKSFNSLMKKDGGINTFITERLQVIFPKWDGDPAWFLENYNINNTEVVARVLNEGDYSNIKMLFSPDKVDEGGGVSELPGSMTKKALAAKYSSKFRAASGGTPVAPAGKPAAKKNTGKAKTPNEHAGVGDARSKLDGNSDDSDNLSF